MKCLRDQTVLYEYILSSFILNDNAIKYCSIYSMQRVVQIFECLCVLHRCICSHSLVNHFERSSYCLCLLNSATIHACHNGQSLSCHNGACQMQCITKDKPDRADVIMKIVIYIADVIMGITLYSRRHNGNCHIQPTS